MRARFAIAVRLPITLLSDAPTPHATAYLISFVIGVGPATPMLIGQRDAVLLEASRPAAVDVGIEAELRGDLHLDARALAPCLLVLQRREELCIVDVLVAFRDDRRPTATLMPACSIAPVAMTSSVLVYAGGFGGSPATRSTCSTPASVS